MRKFYRVNSFLVLSNEFIHQSKVTLVIKWVKSDGLGNLIYPLARMGKFRVLSFEFQVPSSWLLNMGRDTTCRVLEACKYVF